MNKGDRHPNCGGLMWPWNARNASREGEDKTVLRCTECGYICPMSVTQEQVNEALDNATQNGYDLHTWTTDAILEDLNRYCADLEGVASDRLAPMIDAWKARHGAKEQ